MVDSYPISEDLLRKKFPELMAKTRSQRKRTEDEQGDWKRSKCIPEFTASIAFCLSSDLAFGSAGKKEINSIGGGRWRPQDDASPSFLISRTVVRRDTLPQTKN